ncbi:MAG: thioredoxin [Pseudomonadota bacterium]
MNAQLTPVNVSDADFEQLVLNSDRPVLVDFWAAWCGPCRTLAPTLDELAREHGGQVTIAKVNVDENPRAAQAFGIRSLPTLVLVKDAEVKETVVGVQPKSRLQEVINRHSV